MNLFDRYRLGRITLPNRVVMAPMTRSRAIGHVPNDLMRDYYAQRAGAGLIVTEGVAPSADGLGYARIPGLFNEAQVDGWRAVTDAVHAAGGHIVAQLMHTGRVSHAANMPEGARVVAPSAVRAEGMMYTDSAGMMPLPEPVAMTAADVEAARDGFVQAAENAIAAGFDGVELHAANGYLLEQFLNPHTNRRDDTYGGDALGRARFVAEVARGAAEAIGADRVGIRLSPFNTFNDMPLYDGVAAQYAVVAEALRGLMYVHVVRNPHEGFPEALAAIRAGFGGPLILNGGFDLAQAEATLAAGGADLVAFGRPFISNPDLVGRLRDAMPLAAADHTTFYTPGPEGYVDYPTL
ncbi:MAG: alkene reductase [Deltaproteobacteria bacterium]|nr:MAG: alkene reductase [Deltaproteobacteria bacterium]